MPAEGSQWLTKAIASRTSRGDGSRQDHLQTVTYNNQMDRSVRSLSGNKVVESTQENFIPPIRDTDTDVPRTINVTVSLKFLNETITC